MALMQIAGIRNSGSSMMTDKMKWLSRSSENRYSILLGVLTALVTTNYCDLASAEDRPITIMSPVSWQVFQRVGFDPKNTANAGTDNSAFGYAQVEVEGRLPAEIPATVTLQYRVVLTDNGHVNPSAWSSITAAASNLQDGVFHFPAVVPAGGWYRLELATLEDCEGHRACGVVEPFGVGEVFVIAGQSYATNTNEERLRISDPQGRVSALNVANSTWGTAHDPQPTPDGSDGGSIWPALGDSLLREFHVPIGFANVAVGGTSSQQWMPDGTLHPRLKQAGKALGRFRAVLWQQGESDVIGKNTDGNIRRESADHSHICRPELGV